MSLFLAGIALLVIGYFTYGKWVERIVGTDDRETPAKKLYDGVDYLELPQWRNMLIQLLNIAGIGPVIGVILGIKFGTIVFLIIPIGNLIAGATHDFLGGMMSIRGDGMNLPVIIKRYLGTKYYRFFSIFMVLILLLVVAVFINVPAQLVNSLTVKLSSDSGPAFFGSLVQNSFWIAVAVIFVYYVCATLFPVDKIIGKVYPYFGLLLLLGTCAIFGALLIAGFKDPSLFMETAAFKERMFTSEFNPIIPMLFVTIACGIISGFHATQSPIIARTMKHEKQARASFYGMMVVEGIIAMIWAGAGLAIYNLFPEKMALPPAKVLGELCTYFLGPLAGGVTVLAVIVLAITSGDTALRSLRLSLAEIFKVPQTPLKNRFLLCIPLILCVSLLLVWSNASNDSFNILWNYFAWGNQVLAASTLLAAAAWLFGQRKNGWVALIPGMFMTFIVTTYILWISPAHSLSKKTAPYGVGLDITTAYWAAGIICLVVAAVVWRHGVRLANEGKILDASVVVSPASKS